MQMLKNIFLSFIATLLFPIYTSVKTLSFSNTFFSIIYFVLIVLLFNYSDKQNYEKRMKKYTYGLGFLFSTMTACGYSLDNLETVPYRNIYLVIAIIMYSKIFGVLLCEVWIFLEKYEAFLSQKNSQKKIWKKIYQICDVIMKYPIIISIFLLVCWSPCYISVFPGNFIYDATAEFNQIENGFSGNFPMLHSVLITQILSLAYQLTGSYNVGIAMYTILQMLILSFMFSHIIYKFSQHHVNKLLLSLLILYYGIFPVIHILVTSTVRDILFSGLLTYTAFLFWLMISEKEVFVHSILRPAFLGIMLTLTLLARNNNASIVMIVILFLLSIFVWIWARQGERKGAVIFTIVTVSSYFMLSYVLAILCQPYQPANISSSLSILTQPIIRAYLSDENNFTQEEEIELRKFFKGDLVYLSKDGDATKFQLIEMDENNKFFDFFRLWVKIGIKNRAAYMDGILANTEQMWFPNSVINGYKQASTPYDSYDKCYFALWGEIEEPGVQSHFLPNIYEFYKNIGLMISFEKIPIISMLFSIGFQFWILLNCCFYAIYRKCRTQWVSLAIILGYSLISACVPLILLRYFAALFFSFPLVLVFTLQPESTR